MERALVWLREEAEGAEFALVTIRDGRLSARGVAVGVDPLPYRVDYDLTTGDRFVTSGLRVRSSGPDGDARSTCDECPAAPGRAVPAGRARSTWLPPAETWSPWRAPWTCDLARSPLTNSMPVMPHRLLEGGGPIDFTMAWVSVPDLGVHRSEQRYRFIRREEDRIIVEYEGKHRSFVAELQFEPEGFVLRYPGFAYRPADAGSG